MLFTMIQKMNRGILLGMIACLGIAEGCNTPKSTPLFVFNGAGRVTSVDILKRDIYIDTSIKNKGSDVCIMNAFKEGEALPHQGDSLFFHVDSLTNKIDMFFIKKKK
jgi:hypothetical protein